MSVFAWAGIFTVVVLAVVHDRWRESQRRRRVAALLEDTRYGEALEVIWNRGDGPAPLAEAVLYLEYCGVAREDAIANLCRILDVDQAVVDLGDGAGTPRRDAADPWARRPTPAISSAMLLPRQ